MNKQIHELSFETIAQESLNTIMNQTNISSNKEKDFFLKHNTKPYSLHRCVLHFKRYQFQVL